ncbi:MAG: four-carbon acid sugar kinase family protein [Candidatus Caldatribacteriota bacterium]
MIYVIADDLTGANDTGVQFTKKGYNTIVSILDDQSTIIIPEDLSVLVIDTETRGLEEKVARKRLKNILEKLNIKKRDIVYKKVDSTLRGNIGSELEEIMQILNRDICIFSPSYPSHKRITVGGYLIVDHKPLELSEYSLYNFKRIENSFIPLLLKTQTIFPVEQIDLKDVIKGQKTIFSKIEELYQKGNKIIVIDSTSEQHLADIFACGLKFKGTVLFSGSAGLANNFPNLYNKEKNIQTKFKKNDGPVIVVAGSRNSMVEKQINYLKNKSNLKELKIDLEHIFSNKEGILEEYTTKGTEVVKNNNDLVIYTDARYNEEKLINKKLMYKYNLEFRELEIKIKSFFGELTRKIIENSNIRHLILTGGDIALGVCKELKINNLNVIEELMPGVPLTVANYKDYSLNIITKAGGFGKEDTLYNLINKLKFIENEKIVR